MAKGCKKCKPTECEECPEWIFTLADLIMCMMGLFVILWVLKTEGKPAGGDSADSQEHVKQVAAIRDAFSYQPNPASNDPVDRYLIMQKMQGDRAPKGPGEGGQTQPDNDGADGEAKNITNIRPGDNSDAGTRIMFDAGMAVISEEEKKKIVQIAIKYKGHRTILSVVGHTSRDDLAPTASDREKLELSLLRAQAVVEALAEAGVERDVLRPSGAGAFEPVVIQRYGPDVQRPNRRVEIIVTNQLVRERQGGGK